MISEDDLLGFSRQHCFTTPKGYIIKSISMKEPKLSNYNKKSSKWSKEGKQEVKYQIRNQIEHEFYC